MMIHWTLSVLLMFLLHEAALEKVGNADGTLAIVQGRVSYDIPVPYPKYFPNLMEKVTVSYDSSADDGDVGYGWDIGGLSSITRCPQTFAQDGIVRGIEYDNGDKFCLDGQRLVAVKGKYGEDNTVYYTEVDSYMKVTSHGKLGSGPAYFSVRSKDNLIQSFGNGAEYQLVGENQQSVHTWFLDSVRDYVGNEVKVNYLVTKRGRYVSKISHKNLAVIFRYKPRSDVTTTYFKGGVLEVTDKLLDKVTAVYKGKEQSSLTLTHQDSGDSKKNILTKYQLCGRNNQCLKPVTLDYSGLKDLHEMNIPTHWSHDFSSNSGWTSSTIRHMADVSGDGLVDIVGFRDDGVYVSVNQNETFGSPGRWIAAYGSGSAAGGWSTAKHLRLIADVNADGLLDILGFGDDGVYVSLNTGQQTFEQGKKLLREFGYNTGWRVEKHPRFVQDVNGDGLVDIVGLAEDGVRISLGRVTGNSKNPFEFSLSKLVLNDFGSSTATTWREESHSRFLEDVTGDGLPDIVGFHDGGVYVSVNDGRGGFATKTQWISDFGANRQWDKKEKHLEDINGDGLDDIVGFSSTGVVVAINNGKKFLPAENWVVAYGTEAGGWQDGAHPRYTADMNGDGLPDIIGFGCCGVDVSLNTGSNFASPKKWSKHFDSPTWKDKDGPRLLRDVNGDGVADIVGFSHNGVYVSTNKNRRTNLVRIEDSFNNVDEIVYLSLGNASIYTRSQTSTYPAPCVNFGQMVVWKVLSFDGVGGKNVTSYRYGGLKTDVKGRGSLGFERIVETEEGEGESVEKTYHQDFPLTGFESSNAHTVNNVVVSEYENVYETNMIVEGIHQVHRIEEIAHFHDLSGDHIKSITRRFSEVDDYGNFGKVDVELTGDGKTFREGIVNQYAAVNKETWYINQLVSVRSTKSDEKGSLSTTTQFVYDQSTRKLLKEIKEPTNNLGVVIEQIYDSHGNVVRMTQKPIYPENLSNSSSSGRVVSKTYDVDGMLLLSTFNSLQHKESYQFDENGYMIKITGANGLVTRRDFDDMGRPKEERRLDGTIVTWVYDWDTSIPYAKYKVTKEETGKPTEVIIYDSFERPIKTVVDGFKKKVSEDIYYDKYGNVVKQSIPHFLDDKAKGWVTYKYDAFGREIETTKPITKDTFSTSKIEFNGLSTSKTNGLGRTTVTKHDALGRVTKVTDAMGGSTTYTYDPMDNLVKVTDPAGNAVEMKYDPFRNKVESKDPDMGTWLYGYDVYGQLVWQRDAKGQEITMKYDSLGRKVETSHGQSTSKWFYDTADHGVGKIYKVSSTDGFSWTYSYDQKGRETVVSQSFDGETFKVRTAYNSMGRIERQDYPGNKQVYICYTLNGFKTMVKNSACDGGTSGVYWNALEYDPHGHVTKERYGNNLQTEYGYTLGAYASSISTKNIVSGDFIRSWDYEHDEQGNLVYRKDKPGNAATGTSEHFHYDALDRVIRSTIRKTDPNQPVALTEDWEYDATGNIVRYSGLGGLHHEYHKNKPHALKKAGPKRYIYDANGNVIQVNNQHLSWTYFNKLDGMDTVDGDRVKFFYGPDEMRYKKVGPGEAETIYVGKLYERVTKGGRITHKYFIYALGKLVAVESKGESNVPEAIYISSDHQGSVDTITNQQGTVMDTIRYNAYGRIRSSNWWVYQTGLALLQPQSSATKRGYTGHEHIPELDLIHMNGRVYDPLVGRFLSADPFVQDPYNTQSFNRYSYVLNNPLKHNDPTGHFFKKMFKAVKRVVKSVVKIVKKVVKAVVKVVVNTVKAIVNAAKAVVNAVVNTAKQVWKEVKPYIRPAIALALRIGTKIVGGILAGFGPLGVVAGIVIVGLGEYAASRVMGKSHKEALINGLIAGAIFGLTLATAGGSEGFMKAVDSKSPLAHDSIEFVMDYGGYYKDALNFGKVLKENGPPMTLIGLSSVTHRGAFQKQIKNVNIRAGISLNYQNNMDQFPTPFAQFDHSKGPLHGLLIDITRKHLFALLQN